MGFVNVTDAPELTAKPEFAITDDGAARPIPVAPVLVGYFQEPPKQCETLTFDFGATITADSLVDTGPVDATCFEMSRETKACLLGHHDYASPPQSPRGETCTIDLTDAPVEPFVSPPTVEVDENDPMVILRSYENYG